MLTPDSSRFWPADGYQAGRSQPSYDKQFVRDYLESLDGTRRLPRPPCRRTLWRGPEGSTARRMGASRGGGLPMASSGVATRFRSDFARASIRTGPNLPGVTPPVPDDEHLLRQRGHQPELARRMSGFPTSRFRSRSFASWPGITLVPSRTVQRGRRESWVRLALACLFFGGGGRHDGPGRLSVSTAGTLPLGKHAGRTRLRLGHTAWFNLAGLVTVVAAVNAGTYDFATAAFGFAPSVSGGNRRSRCHCRNDPQPGAAESLWNPADHPTHRSQRLAILLVAVVMTASLLVFTPHFEWSRLWTFTNFSGLPEGSPAFRGRTACPGCLPWA